ncbi:hypothetical protein DM01DRAFT_1340174 [Hesseltinella vesiculosa]|uniref:Uncharacterized protein n=1 Tax=Hesseltinella vesiculosa TaxID=101127 RepID=A0A1X2G4V3_9FUNG|nr:hypothetical protein DM01DRAFT_1340174 [Hesseltinella vesiculosa]
MGMKRQGKLTMLRVVSTVLTSSILSPLALRTVFTVVTVISSMARPSKVLGFQNVGLTT